MPKGYWIARITVREPERYPEYVATAAPAYQRHGAKLIVRGGQFTATEGEARPRNVVVEFPSYQAALDCYNSPEYTAARAIRQAISDGEFLIVEGHDG
ncbi:MAG: DUF1330 domain-containing protein [Rhizobiaceae bacterium]|jgi:uncharacterized protein (DUF1330 family)|nr:DUF1330 domain-containing protein [Rhizobiaceae bacterium]